MKIFFRQVFNKFSFRYNTIILFLIPSISLVSAEPIVLPSSNVVNILAGNIVSRYENIPINITWSLNSNAAVGILGHHWQIPLIDSTLVQRDAGMYLWTTISGRRVNINSDTNEFRIKFIETQPGDPPICKWTLLVDDDDPPVWSWSISDMSSAVTNADTATITANTVEAITASVIRNDEYNDTWTGDGGGSTNEQGTWSPTSTTTTVHVVQVWDLNPDKKWYYFNSPSSPFPAEVEQHNFYIQGDAPPQDSNYNWGRSDEDGGTGSAYYQDSSSDPNQAGQYETGVSTSIGDIEPAAYWGGNNLGDIPTTIYTACYSNNILEAPTDISTSYSVGWQQIRDVYYYDDFGGKIRDGIGLNEKFGPRSDDYQVRYALTETPYETEGSIFSDGYKLQSYRGLGSIDSSTAVPPTDEHAQDILFTVHQTYSIGSKVAGDGEELHEQDVTYCRGCILQ